MCCLYKKKLCFNVVLIGVLGFNVFNWLVQKEVKLPDGGTQTVLVPQVYVRVKNGDIDGKGALLSGSNTQINVSGSLRPLQNSPKSPKFLLRHLGDFS